MVFENFLDFHRRYMRRRNYTQIHQNSGQRVHRIPRIHIPGMQRTLRFDDETNITIILPSNYDEYTSREMLSLLENGTSSDMRITCQGYSWDIHADIFHAAGASAPASLPERYEDLIGNTLTSTMPYAALLDWWLEYLYCRRGKVPSPSELWAPIKCGWCRDSKGPFMKCRKCLITKYCSETCRRLHRSDHAKVCLGPIRFGKRLEDQTG
ncbi:uncharacterized protein BDZ99DRAFT_468015 [Mytilinidion resinicola]|uniref:MYND-type domain-containing protein n=1 Tax=Mytilinidion resinicola TaxID=574789 RepID=A0A6A6Y4L3_9PEZI|nr:uncharacterized protein BDZ99DRAFT_468015 [Mytilinidion resinicola]KAF2803458.1 hypothetical protein BDZ99DRAFT_468015 [Mytilinidion resinicola]